MKAKQSVLAVTLTVVFCCSFAAQVRPAYSCGGPSGPSGCRTASTPAPPSVLDRLALWLGQLFG